MPLDEHLPLPDSLPLGESLSLSEPIPLEPPAGAPDPFASVEYGQGVEVDSANEMAAIRTAFLQRAKDESKRFADATDSEFWFCVTFQSREQKEAFLQQMNWLTYGDKYLDGTRVAARQGIELPEAKVRFVSEKPDATLTELSLPLE